MTYGGWTQGKALGQRIAALLHQRDTEPAYEGQQPQNGEKKQKRKKRKIIIHSSPFLRCIQTSTAVAAGITQYESLPLLTSPPSTAKAPAPPSPATLPLVQPLFDPSLEISYKPRVGPDRILLRIDAFLGEWLSPDYFQDITPPPSSTMMVAGAKADLLRRGDQIQEMASSSSRGHFPGGWGGSPQLAVTNRSTMSSTSHGRLAHVASVRERSSSDASTLTLQRVRSRDTIASTAPPTHVPVTGRAYDPPAPSYSVAPSDPIPRGYVAHAQDACIQVDFQWDSMRPPQNWGDGGEYGDEWSTMHKRFRKGMTGMMQWYGVHGAEPPREHIPGFMFKVLSNKQTPPPALRTGAESASDADTQVDAEDDEELILILVTHSAGCNALLGAMSNQPVLIDIGLASLSMAVRTKVPTKSPAPSLSEAQSFVAGPCISETYEIKHLASIDHLRPGVDPAKPPQTLSQSHPLAKAASPSSDSRRRISGPLMANCPPKLPSPLTNPHINWDDSLGSVRRTKGSRPTYPSNFSPANGGIVPIGLWSGNRTIVDVAESQNQNTPGADMMLKSSPSQQPDAKTTRDIGGVSNVKGVPETTMFMTNMDLKQEQETDDMVAPLLTVHDRKGSLASSGGLWSAKSQHTTIQGLWGPPRLDDMYQHDPGPKRRWTMTGREEAS